MQERLWAFMVEEVFPAEPVYRRQLEQAGDPHAVPAVLDELKGSARSRGLWNQFLPDVSGLSDLEYAGLAELMGWSLELAPQAINCNAPDTGNIETLHLFGTEAQKRQWLEPLLEGEIRSAFAMTEPEVASSDATNITTSIVRDGDEYVVDGRKWWATNGMDPRTRVMMIVMGKTDPAAPRHRQQSMVLVPVDTPGVEVVRSTSVLGFDDRDGHRGHLPTTCGCQPATCWPPPFQYLSVGAAYPKPHLPPVAEGEYPQLHHLAGDHRSTGSGQAEGDS